jgi:cbb3-type cytochrome oxidase maturation protein
VSVFYVLVPLALLLAGAGVLAFRWAVRDGQYDDVETPALRMLLDDEVVPPGPHDADAPDLDPHDTDAP